MLFISLDGVQSFLPDNRDQPVILSDAFSKASGWMMVVAITQFAGLSSTYRYAGSSQCCSPESVFRFRVRLRRGVPEPKTLSAAVKITSPTKCGSKNLQHQGTERHEARHIISADVAREPPPSIADGTPVVMGAKENSPTCIGVVPMCIAF